MVRTRERGFWFWILALIVADSARAMLVTWLTFHRIQPTLVVDRWGWPEIARCTLVPLVEEFLFRGVLIFLILLFIRWFLSEEEKYASVWEWGMRIWVPVIIVQAVLFGAVHDGGWGVMTNAFFGGIVYGFAFWKTRNLIPCILAHAWFNFMVTVLP